GDANNEADEGKCGDSGETSLVTQAKPAIKTSATSPVSVGANVKDVATISGLSEATGKGTITFKLYSDSKCETTPVFESTSAGISANGNVNSGEYTTKATGTYYWIASFSADVNNEAVEGKCGDSGESSLVNQAKPAIKTSATSPVTVGANVKDVATISGLSEATGKGTITFKLYSDSKCETTPVFESKSAGISANGNVNSGEYTTKATGTYYWIASFSADVNNEAVEGKCGDSGESSLVNQAKPAIKTSATSPVTVGANVKDVATISGLSEATGKGTITFKLYSDSKCETTPVFESKSAG